MRIISKNTNVSFHLIKFILVFAFLWIAIGLNASKLAYAQNQVFTLNFKNVSIETVLKAIEKQSEFIFMYRSDLTEISKKISVKANAENIISILNRILDNTSLTYEINDRQIIIKRSIEKKVNSSLQGGKNKKKVQGLITDDLTKEPIIGAAVQIKGTGQGTTSDMDGGFILDCQEGDTLIVSYIGYRNSTIIVKSANIYAVTLKESTEQLGEVVVTAFGTGQKKESVVGSIQTVRPNDLRVPSTGLSNSFAGRLAGVISFQRNGQPGEGGSDFYIRGISTLSGMTSPLIILDGLEIDARELNAIDPEIIEDFSILKDATATAMYGTRGANGVMIIKTKSGEALDRPVIGFRVEANVKTPYRIPKYVDGPQYMRMFNEAIANQGTADAPFSDDEIEMTALGTYPYLFPNVDWYNEVFEDHTFNQKANFNIRGGTNRITYFMNVSVNHETGMLKNRSRDFYSYDNNYDMKRYTFQNNLDFQMTKSSKISLHLNADLVDMLSPNESMSTIYNSFLSNNPVDFPVYFPNDAIHGNTNWVKWGVHSGAVGLNATNPVEKLTNGYLDSFSSTINATIDFDQKLDILTKGLRFKAMFSFKNYTKSNTKRYQNDWNYYAVDSWEKNPDGTYSYSIKPFTTPEKPVLNTSIYSSGHRRFYFQSYLDYTRSFGNHNVNGMILFNMDSYIYNNASSLLSSLPRHKMGYALRLSYDWKHRYMLEFNAGYNGSENFAEGHRWGFFPSIAVGWNISEESFWEPMKNIVSFLKLRASYGLVGNDQLNAERFIYLSDIDLTGSGSFTTGYGDNKVTYSGPKYKRFQNNDITWEVGHKLNVGLEMRLFNDLKIDLDVFKEHRENIFQARSSIPSYLGSSGIDIYGNFAAVDNWGVDLSVDYGKQITRDFFMAFKGTFTFARNKVVEYDEPFGIRIARSKIGKPVHQLFGYVADGLYRDEEDIANSPTSTLGSIAIAPGDIKYLDQPDNDGNYDGQITADDLVPMGHPSVPEIVYGFGPSMTYKKVDFSFFFQGVANTSIMLNANSFAPFGANVRRNVLQFIADDYWSNDNPNPNAAYHRLTRDYNTHNGKWSSYWLRNGAFLKLKNIELGYSFKKCRLYVSGENLLTFSPFKLWDPEMGSGGAQAYPNMRTFNIGLQVTFK